MEDKWCEIKMKGFQMGEMKGLKKETGSRIWNDMSKRIRSQVKENIVSEGNAFHKVIAQGN